jgi:hypothetical protein
MSRLHETLYHIRAHAAQPDHSQLHRTPPPKV